MFAAHFSVTFHFIQSLIVGTAVCSASGREQKKAARDELDSAAAGSWVLPGDEEFLKLQDCDS